MSTNPLLYPDLSAAEIAKLWPVIEPKLSPPGPGGQWTHGIAADICIDEACYLETGKSLDDLLAEILRKDADCQTGTCSN